MGLKFGFSELFKPTPKSIKRVGSGLSIFCATFSLSLLANDYKISGMIIGGLGVFLKEVVIPMFSFEQPVDSEGEPKE